MNTFRKYDKVYRIEMPNYPIRGKYLLAKKKEKLLMNGNCTITEKIDGGNTGIYKVNGKSYLQKKGSNIDYSHPQFSFFQNEWYWNNVKKLAKLPNNIVVYGELMRCVHTIKYDNLPDWWIVFDIYDLKKKKYMKWKEIKKISDDAGFHTVPLIYEGKIDGKNHLAELMPDKSAFGNVAEGIVVKNYRQQVMGKIVKPEFIKVVDESKFWREKKIVMNKVI